MTEDVDRRMALVRSVAAEIVGEPELRALLEAGVRPVAYDGFEPSGRCHLPFGVYRPLIMEELRKAGFSFKLLLADSFAWINGKLGGDLQNIRLAGEYFMEVWRAAGVPVGEVEVVWHKDLFDDPAYWKRVLLIAKNHSVQRTMRSLAVAGREAGVDNPTAFLFYPSMQCADIFELGVDVCQLGLDQRKVNILAREVADKMGWRKPICVHHPLIPGLQPPEGTVAYDEDANINLRISSKMSKSKPHGAVFVHDTAEDLHRKLMAAWCPRGEVDGNPALTYAKEIVLRKLGHLHVERTRRHGGDIEFTAGAALDHAFTSGELHPADLKLAVARALDGILHPIRSHFETVGRARDLYEQVSRMPTTR